MILSEIAVIPIENIKKTLEKKSLMKNFSDNEIKYCSKFKNSYIHFAGKLAAKKASIKILKKISKKTYLPSDMEIMNLSSGRPVIILRKKIENNNLKISLSISHTRDTAVALCSVNV